MVSNNFIRNIALIVCILGSLYGCGSTGSDHKIHVTDSATSDYQGDTGSISYNIRTGDTSQPSLSNDTSSESDVIGNNSIKVHYLNESGTVNSQVFGSALEGWDYDLIENKGSIPSPARTNYGMGVWNPASGETVNEVISLAKEAGLSAMRFTTTNFYEWKMAISKERTQFLFGIDEFLRATAEIGAMPIFTIGYMLDDPQDAADLVEYLNAPNDGSHLWAAKRYENGHAAPYGAKYFEIGNETAGKTTAAEYALRYLEYYDAMKSVDPSVQIGISLIASSWWDQKVLELIRDKVDFGIIHIYPKPPGFLMLDERIKTIDPSDLFCLSLATTTLIYEVEIQRTLQLLKNYSSKNVPLVVSEHNGGFGDNDPVRYRHTLGTALINAELLRIFMKPENNILMANNHTFINGHWGMIRSEDNFMTHNYQYPVTYIKRPNYYVYEIYKNYFGQILIKSDTMSASYNITENKSYADTMGRFLYSTDTNVPYLSVNSSKSSDGSAVYLIVLNKSIDKFMRSSIQLLDLPAEWTSGTTSLNISTHVLNGAHMAADNESYAYNVQLSHNNIIVNETSFELIFEPHSLTAIEIRSQ
ncbi:MAG: hypothetical protein AB1499_08695 [Nitrospirota bacterium]